MLVSSFGLRRHEHFDPIFSAIGKNMNSSSQFFPSAIQILTVWIVVLAIPAQAQVADGYLRRWVDKRVRQMDARFVRGEYERIGWADGIGHAIKVAKKHKRPIFLFTLDGHMSSGRC